MRTLVHLSDLHFGRVDPALLEPLRRCVNDLAPHLVAISGDLTQRAKPEQFREARAFLDALPRPQIVVPGNHDVPLYNVFRRFVKPLDRFRRIVSSNLEPTYVDGEIAVAGVNTARSLVFKGGRINEVQIERVRGVLCNLDERIVKIVVTHHPFDLPPSWDERHIVGRARLAIEALARCGADVLLAGHVHMSHTGSTAERYRIGDFSALVVQAGTATSTRGRGEANSFNVLRVDTREIRVERFAWNSVHGDFRQTQANVFKRTPRGWSSPRPAQP